MPVPVGGENLVGPLGRASAAALVQLFSWGSLILPLLAVIWGAVLVRGRGRESAARFSLVAGAGVLACLTAFALLRSSAEEPAGGMLAMELAAKLRGTFGVVGTLLIVALGVLLTLIFTLPDDTDAPDVRTSKWRSGLRRLGAALMWTAGVLVAGAVWLVSWAAGLVGVIGVAVAAGRTRITANRRAEARVGQASAAGAGNGDRTTAAALEGGERGATAAAAGERSAPAPARAGGRDARSGVAAADGAAENGESGWGAGLDWGVPAPARRGTNGRRRQEPPWEVPLDLFDPVPLRDAVASERELADQAGVLIRKLADFNVHGEVVRISSGPVITMFEVEPAPGIKVNQIANLADDLALAMRAQRIRIVAPIPGKGAVGIEIPNARPERVMIRELLASPAFTDFPGTLPIALGKEISGTPVVADLTRMPHLLIAGSTGAGKSVCINALLTSLLFRFSPAQLRLVLIDPKMLELSMYNDVPHLLHPVVTRAKDAAIALKWAVYEMERRFELLARNAVRNVADFNARLLAGAELAGVDSKLGSADEPLAPLPYVVVIVDELADLMLTVQGEIEEPLARLAQKARAVGIHMVLATQRPSVNVLTGFIKANFPSRISFQVASKTDSRTVLDQNGAEALLGSGDMLFLPADRAVPMRIQGAYVSARETEALVAHLRKLGEALLSHMRATSDARELAIRETIDLGKVEGAELGEGGAGDRDELFLAAARVVLEHDQGSTSLLQRRLKVGYSRAARIVDQLERHGVLGPPDGSKPREVRIGWEELAELEAAGTRGTGVSPRSTSSL